MGIKSLGSIRRQGERCQTRSNEGRSNAFENFGHINESMFLMFRIGTPRHQQNGGRGQGRHDTGQRQEDSSIERRFIDPISGKGLDQQGRQSHEREGGSHRPFVPTNAHQVNALENIEAIAQFSQTKRHQDKGNLRRYQGHFGQGIPERAAVIFSSGCSADHGDSFAAAAVSGVHLTSVDDLFSGKPHSLRQEESSVEFACLATPSMTVSLTKTVTAQTGN